jgi:hypothetical protein
VVIKGARTRRAQRRVRGPVRITKVDQHPPTAGPPRIPI